MKLIDKLITIVGIGCCLFALFLYSHEVITGGGYIANVKVKLVAIYGMTPFNAQNFAAVIILIVPLIACAGMLALRVKK